MAEGKESLGPSGVNTVGVTVPEKDATAGDVARVAAGCDDMVVRPGEPCYWLQDPCYCSSLLFPMVEALEVSPPGVPKK